MASESESSYFPPLEKLFLGGEHIISWKTASLAIEEAEWSLEDADPTIKLFFSNTEVLKQLSRPSKAFAASTPQTKSAFETKTSAINITPSASAPYDIKEVKEDTIWLSQKAKIDEISALRVVLVECQLRASTQLLGRLSREEIASIQGVLRNSNTTSPLSLAISAEAAHFGPKPDLDSQESRQTRLLNTYLSERRYLIRCAETATCYYRTHSGQDQSTIGEEKSGELSWLARVGETVAENFKDSTYFSSCISDLGQNIESLHNGSGWDDEGKHPELQISWEAANILELTHMMGIFFHVLDSTVSSMPSNVVLEWFRLSTATSFFADLPQLRTPSQSLVTPMQSIALAISVAILGLVPCLRRLGDQDDNSSMDSNATGVEYIRSPKAIQELHELFMNIASAPQWTSGPAILAWCIIIRELKTRVQLRQAVQQGLLEDHDQFDPSDRSTFAENELVVAPDTYEDVLEEIMDSAEGNPIDFLADSAINGSNVLETLSSLTLVLGDSSRALFSATLGARVRIMVLDLLHNCSPLGYSSELIDAVLSALNGGQSYWGLVEAPQSSPEIDPIITFAQSSFLTGLLSTALSRFPYESLPLIKLARSIATGTSHDSISGLKMVLTLFERVPTFTYILPENFQHYETTMEEEDNNSIRLTKSVGLFEPRSRMTRGIGSLTGSLALTRVDPDFQIKAGTLGRLVSEFNPKVAYWFHEYSGYKYLGKLLETYLTAGDQVDATTGEVADQELVAEIIGLLATLLLGMAKSPELTTDAMENAHSILEATSSGLSRNRDIISVIFDIFEEELQRQSSQAGSDVPIEVISSCIQFIHALLTISPGRVWSLLIRNGFLEVGRGKLPDIIGSVELISGRYEILLACTRLFESLIEEFVTNTVPQKYGLKTSDRWSDRQEQGGGLPEQVLSKTLLSYTRYMVDVLESSCAWKFETLDDLRELNRNIMRAFNNILCYSYGLEGTPDSASHLMRPLSESAAHIVDSFLNESSSTLRFQPLLHVFYDGFDTTNLHVFPIHSRLQVSQIVSALSLSKTLLRVGIVLERPSSYFRGQLFNVSSLIARLYAVNEGYRPSVVALFEALVVSASTSANEPPSLLGHLGAQTSKAFLQVLCELDQPLSRTENVVSIWHFLSMVVSNRQQWSANYLLTGRTPRDALKKKGDSEDIVASKKPLLVRALDKLSNLNDCPKAEALAMLEFVALAQNFWPWAVYDLQPHETFIKSITEYAGHLKPTQPSKSLDPWVDTCYETRMAGHIAEILAMHLFHSRQTGKPPPSKDFLFNLDYFKRFAAGAPIYNVSLHSQLKRNFEKKYPGCGLQNFKRSRLDDRPMGKEFFYNRGIADKMLGFNEAWFGKKNNGYREEMAFANVNLFLVDSQISLLKGWKFLAIELSNNLNSDTEAQKLLAGAAYECLRSNKQNQLKEEVFMNMCQDRAEFALILVQRLVEANSTIPEMKGLLSAVWDTIRAIGPNFEQTLGSENGLYYRTLLKLLFLALRPHRAPKTQDEFKSSRPSALTQGTPVIQIVLQVLEHVIAIGLRELVTSIHDQPQDSSPEDIALITGILQACLQVSGIEIFHNQIVNLISMHETARVATTLFSWSDSLAIQGDPIYGELSILFLLELSSMSAMAEQLAIDGIVGHISAANLTTYLRRKNISPFAEGAGFQRCYSIWVRGILPLLLNLLDAVGASIATEVALFLLQFPTLLQNSTEALDAPEASRTSLSDSTKYIVLSNCSEIHSLALITFILSGFRELGAAEVPDVPWDAASALESVEFWLSSRMLLKERILPMGPRESELARRKAGAGSKDAVRGSANMLEEKVVMEFIGVRDVLGGNDN